MTDVRIGKLRRRYRLPVDDVTASERARIDRAFNAALENELFDAALERAGISASDEVCIRRVESVVRLNTGADDAKLAAFCSVAFADAIVTELANGGPNVVRFGSRRQALIDMTLSVARGNLERAWAWRRLELWTGDVIDSLCAAEREVFAALVRWAADATHVLVALADAGLLAPYVVNVPDSNWSALAKAVLAESQAHWLLVDAEYDGALYDEAQRDDHSYKSDDVSVARESHNWLVATADRISQTSSLLRSVVASGKRLSPALARALSALALVECDPALAASARGGEIGRVIAKHLDVTQETHTIIAPQSQPARMTESDEPVDARVHLPTQFGGLLFLLHAVRALDLPDVIATHSELRTRSPRWVLHELAALLVQQAMGDEQHESCDVQHSTCDMQHSTCDMQHSTQDVQHATRLRDDASTFIFAGVVAGSTRDGTFHDCDAARSLTSESVVTALELDALLQLATDIVAWLRERGGALPDETDVELLRRITQRSAEIVADAAWVEARFSVNDTSTDIRRAGLDLDVGWMPSIGMVVRFVYA
jgi:hypothetical protein